MKNYDPREALSSIWKVITLGNQFVEETKPWVLAKDPAKKKDLGAVLVSLGECISHLAVILIPFLPHTSSQMLERMGMAADLQIPDTASFRQRFTKSGMLIQKGTALFPKLEENPHLIPPPQSGGG